MGSERLIIFLKAPRPGCVKTRLARELGAVPACEAYQQMVDCLLANLATLPQVELCLTPDDAAEEIAKWARPGWRMRPQGNGDLGLRLVRAFDRSFSEGAARVLIIGSDCPTITVEDIHAGWDSLKQNEVVLGPAADGGYWLIGLRKRQPFLFENVAWSTSTVLTATLRKMEKAGLRTHLLRTRRDIDSRADWEAFLKDPVTFGQTG